MEHWQSPVSNEMTKYIPRTDPVSSDDFTITDDAGTEYHPHEGEWVVFRRDLPWRATRLRADLTNAVFARQVVKVLARQILDWNWTDDYDETLPNPSDRTAFVESLWDLSDRERDYLLDKMWVPAQVPNE